MRSIIIGISFGVLAGTFDLIPMLVQKLPWDADLSAFSMWVVVGFFISTSRLKLPAPLLGLVTSFLCLIPSAIIIGAKEPFTLVPITIMTAILGTGLGWAVKRFERA
jgi:hypothetical protein